MTSQLPATVKLGTINRSDAFNTDIRLTNQMCTKPVRGSGSGSGIALLISRSSFNSSGVILNRILLYIRS